MITISSTDFSSISKVKKNPIFNPAPELFYETSCNNTIQLPELYSAQGSSISSTFDFRLALGFVKNISSNTLYITLDCQPGQYLIQVKLTDDDNRSSIY